MPKKMKNNKAPKVKGEGSASMPKAKVQNVKGGDKIQHNPKKKY